MVVSFHRYLDDQPPRIDSIDPTKHPLLCTAHLTQQEPVRVNHDL